MLSAFSVEELQDLAIVCEIVENWGPEALVMVPNPLFVREEV